MTVHAGEDVEQGNVPPLLMGVQTYTATIEINKAFPQKIVNKSISRPSYNTLDYIPKDAVYLCSL